MTLQPLECIARFVCICGVFGNIGPKKEGKEVNVHATEVCMIR